MPTTDAQTMQCLEVFGGNAPVDSSVSVVGLNAWVYCKPFEDAEGGGDVYYVSSCATGRITRLLLADVSGHGNLVSDTATQLRSFMRRYVNYLDQTSLVRAVNARFSELSRDGSFATALVMTFFAPTGALTLCNAGHPPPMIRRGGVWETLDSAIEGCVNFPLGIVEAGDYQGFETDLSEADLILCYTDALPEARIGGTGAFLGYDGLCAILNQIDGGAQAARGESATLVPRLLAAIESAGFKTDDDVTVMLFQPSGQGKRVTWVEKLKMAGRLLRTAPGIFRGEPLPLPDLSIANIGGCFIDALQRVRPKRGRPVKPT
jgi:phosphoserine phosphatase RsbU/P